MKKISQAGLNRRQFLKSAATVGAVVGFPTIIPSSALGKDGKVAPSNRVTMAAIGTGNMGLNNLRAFIKDERVQFVAVCDVNKEGPGYWQGGIAGREPGRRLVEEYYAKNAPSGTYKGCDAYEDFREVLGRADVDTVLISTPDHWHAVPVVLAAKAGKDIYCEKPLSLTIAEGRAMSDAVKKYKRVFQTGSQQRSDPNFRHAAELVRNGRIGKLQTVKCGLPPGRIDYGKTGDRKKPEPVPEGFNYDLWLGPAPEAPYAPARCHVNFRWIYDYSGGQVTDWGGHHPDIAQWAMGMEHTGPTEIMNARGVFPSDELWNTATEFYFECYYKNGMKMVVSDKFPQGITFEGSEGTIFVTRGKFASNPPAVWTSKIGENETRLYKSDQHHRNFIDCVLSRKPTVAPCEVAHRSITVAHLGNIAMKLGRNLKWDPDAEKFKGDKEAQSMVSRPYRGEWSLKV